MGKSGREKAPRKGRGEGTKKKRFSGSSEVLSQKPPSGRPKKNKLLLEPRGPLYGDGEENAEFCRHSALLNPESSLSLSELTNINHHTDEQDIVAELAADTGGEREGEGGKELEPLANQEEESLSLADFLEPQHSPGAGDASVWQEYGQI